MSVEERLACQATLEDIRWSETIWPAQNPEPKPDRQSVLSDAQLRDKVEDRMRQEAVLAADYGQRIDAASLQRELNRMAKFTRAPDRLSKRFEALGNDADRIAQCLARPHLVQQRLRAAYAADPRQHGTLREADRLEVRVRNSPKRSFDNWWAERRQHTAGFEAAPVNGLKLPTIQGQAMDMSKAAADSWEPRSHSTPAGRFGHSAVWSGSEMIVWGGVDDSGEVNTGGRYDPATDTWSAATSTLNAPSARQNHSAVWSGSEMIVWGGQDGSFDLLNTGGRYNPATDNWGATTSTTGAPSARFSHSAIWTGSEMIVWGGFHSGNLSNTGGRYSPSTNTWGATTSTTEAPSARVSHSAVWTGSEMIVWGGDGGGNTGGRYNPATNSWGDPTATSDAPSARQAHSAVWTGSEMIVWGGTDGNILNSGGRYDPATNTWGASINTTNAPSARRFHSAVWTDSEMIVWGGLDGSFANTGGRYNPATDSWGQATNNASGAPEARYFHSAVWTGSEMIFWGGEGVGINNQFNTGGRYDPATDSWGEPTATTDAPDARIGHSAVWTGSEMIIWGGSVGASGVNTGGRYDPASNTWVEPTNTTNAPSARFLHSAVWTGSEMIVWGGLDGSFANTGGRYDPLSDTWGNVTETDGAPSARYLHSAVWTGSEMIVWGGVDGGLNSVNTGGRYDPAEDSWGAATATSAAPSPRNSHSAVWTGSEMIVWGGFDGSSTNTGGRYDPDGDTWGAATATNGAPSARVSHSAIWTAREMIVWGGSNDASSSSGALNDMALYYPYDTASLTTLTSLAPSPSLVNEAVTATVQVASPDRAPVDGTVTVTATTGESCSDNTPAAIDALTVEFTCDLSFASGGTREVSAAFADSSSHDDSSSDALMHSVVLPPDPIFADGFE